MVCCCNTIGNVFRLVIVCGCVFALGMQWTILYTCDLFNYRDSTDSIGIWYESMNAGMECNPEPYTVEESSLVAASRSAMVLSMLFGIGAGALVLIEWVFCEICCAGCVQNISFVAAWACGLGVYAIYGIEECGNLRDELGDDLVGQAGSGIVPDGIPTGRNCEWGRGATLNLLACIAYFGCGVLLCFAPQPKPLCKN